MKTRSVTIRVPSEWSDGLLQSRLRRLSVPDVDARQLAVTAERIDADARAIGQLDRDCAELRSAVDSLLVAMRSAADAAAVDELSSYTAELKASLQARAQAYEAAAVDARKHTAQQLTSVRAALDETRAQVSEQRALIADLQRRLQIMEAGNNEADES